MSENFLKFQRLAYYVIDKTGNYTFSNEYRTSSSRFTKQSLYCFLFSGCNRYRINEPTH